MLDFTNFDTLSLQKSQYSHDLKNHFDILSLHKEDRLKHYALHYAKYTGRLFRGKNENKTEAETCIDSLLVCLSAANSLHQKLKLIDDQLNVNDLKARYADASGRFCDGCEKIDHLEPFHDLLLDSNLDIFNLTIALCEQNEVDIESAISERRQTLADKQFFIEG